MGLLGDHLENARTPARCDYSPPPGASEQDGVLDELKQMLTARGTRTQWLWEHTDSSARVGSLRPRQVQTTALVPVGRGWPVWDAGLVDVRTPADFAVFGAGDVWGFLLEDTTLLAPAQRVNCQTHTVRTTSQTAGRHVTQRRVTVDGTERPFTGDVFCRRKPGPWTCGVPGHHHPLYAATVDDLVRSAAYTLERLSWARDMSTLAP